MLWYSLEAPRRGASNEYQHFFISPRKTLWYSLEAPNEYQQHIFSWRKKKTKKKTEYYVDTPSYLELWYFQISTEIYFLIQKPKHGIVFICMLLLVRPRCVKQDAIFTYNLLSQLSEPECFNISYIDVPQYQI